MLSVDIRKKLGGFTLSVKFVSENETLALLGASGSGKSVTLRCIAGILKPDSGRIVLNGRVLFDSEKHIDVSPQDRRIGYLFQQYALFPNMTVRENIAVAVRDKKLKTMKTDELIRRFQLAEVASLHPKQLSGGQQQRAALARILATDPEALLLDEPFSALDSYLRAQLEQELRDTLDLFGGSVVWVTHDRDEVFRNCARICVLDGGSSQAAVSPRELFHDPETVSAAKLSGCKNVVPIVPEGEKADIPCWRASLCCDRDTRSYSAAGIRAHHLYFCEKGAPNSLDCRVVRVMDNVFSTVVILRPEGSEPDAPTLRMELDKTGKKPGDRVFVSVAPENILLLKDREDGNV